MNKIQRKFLMSADIQRWLKKQILRLEKIEQFYIKSNRDTTCYYLKHFPNTYTKVMTDKEGKEELLTVTEEEYTVQRKNYIGKKIAKKSYTVSIDGETFVFFEYLKKLKGLYVLVAYFKDAKSMRDSETLQTLQTFILKEIDKDEKYDHRSLALYVKPMEYDLGKLFENIDAFEAANLFFWQVPGRIYVRDGVALIVYKNLRLINYYKVNYQQKHLSATLHRLRVLLRRTATILETFSELFNPKIQHYCTNLLLRYHEETKLLRYLYFFGELSTTRENIKLSLFSELKSLTSQEEQAVAQMFLSQPFIHLIQILKRELYEQEYQQYNSLKKEVKKAVKKRLKLFEMLLAQTKEGYDEEMLEQLYTSMDSLQTLMEDFFHIIGEKEAQMIIDELNILLKPLREYRNCKERAIIFSYMKEQSENSTLDTDPLLCENIDAVEEKIENALKLLRTSKFYI
ncbi:MAG: hypothetical protein KC427_00855 [Sulfurovum sp.]|uniref:hypothetical protein n=1 Tax=Sulfurovum sp. TaxID=1969726 RepID=UPI002867F91B|nr:hypothetical protein [Sulfurovum sp.]MCO4844547.1 hypothetical protein [Sulfurovum sp.]